jgi:dienelactone hydrolase
MKPTMALAALLPAACAGAAGEEITEPADQPPFVAVLSPRRHFGPPAHRAGSGRAGPQLIEDLQRAVDVLRARADVGDERIAFEGYSYGGMPACWTPGTRCGSSLP